MGIRTACELTTDEASRRAGVRRGRLDRLAGRRLLTPLAAIDEAQYRDFADREVRLLAVLRAQAGSKPTALPAVADVNART